MLAGRKLLLADDSVAIQKVIDLTFTDEGMKVTIVGDGDRALDKLEEMAPDIVLADITMPGVDGYELCRIIKQSERLNAIPVMLLVGSFEPFNEAKARRVGANDVVTKPFQSIRDLVNRVGSLLGNKPASETPAYEYSTLGLGRTDEVAQTAAPASESISEPDVKVMVEAPAPDDDSMQDEDLTVLVEAAPIPEHESPDVAGPACDTDVETQTADTLQMERITDEQLSSTSTPIAYAQDDTIEIERVMEVEQAVEEASPVVESETVSMEVGTASIAPPAMKPSQTVVPPATTDRSSDSLLDLDFASAGPPASDEGLILDLDFEESAIMFPPQSVGESTATAGAGLVTVPSSHVTEVSSVEVSQKTEAAALGETQVEPQAWAIVSEPSVHETTAASVIEEEQTPSPGDVQAENLSEAAIDAIARRVVEQMSDRVVREIAWEVVPELAELLIKERLDQEK